MLHTKMATARINHIYVESAFLGNPLPFMCQKAFAFAALSNECSFMYTDEWVNLQQCVAVAHSSRLIISLNICAQNLRLQLHAS